MRLISVGRIGLALGVAAGFSLLLTGSPKPVFTKHDKAYYADANTVNFVRPGLVIKIINASIANDGTITTRFRLSDPKDMPLDREGITTPGVVAPGFIAAYLPKGQTQYVAYTTRVQTSPITKVSATQAGTDTGGKYEKVAEGEYIYTFGTKAPANFDKTATHTIGISGNRNLTEFDMGTNFASATYNFVPDGSPVKQTRDVVRDATCNKCHDQIAFHGGSRRGMAMCVLCHTPQTTDPDTGNTVDMIVMTHKIHMGKDLPSVKAGGKYSIIGFNQNETDYSTVGYPAYGGPSGERPGAVNCQSCHENNRGAAQQDAWLSHPTRAACGS